MRPKMKAVFDRANRLFSQRHLNPELLDVLIDQTWKSEHSVNAHTCSSVWWMHSDRRDSLSTQNKHNTAIIINEPATVQFHKLGCLWDVLILWCATILSTGQTFNSAQL